MAHEVFISYSSVDREVAQAVCETLEENGILCWIAPRNIMPGVDWTDAIIDGIHASKVMVLVFSSHSNESVQVKREVQRAFENGITVVPLRIQDIRPGRGLEYYISSVHWLDAISRPLEECLQSLGENVRHLMGHLELTQQYNSGPTLPPMPPLPGNVPSLLRSPEPPRFPIQTPTTLSLPITKSNGRRIALITRRNTKADERLANALAERLRQKQFDVQAEGSTVLGMQWVAEAEARLRGVDVVIPVVSASALQSEMFEFEVQTAHTIAQEPGLQNRPRLLPVWVVPEGTNSDATLSAIDGPLADILPAGSGTTWRTEADDDTVAAFITDALTAPVRTHRSLIGQRETVGGAVPLGSPFYVVRDTDAQFNEAVARQDSIILIKGGRQMGKTSLLARGLQQGREAGAKVIFQDMQGLASEHLASTDALYRAFADTMADQLDLEILPETVWNDKRAANVNLERYLRREVLGSFPGPLIMGLDEADRLFTCSFGSEVFGLFRSWHNRRSLDPTGPWSRLTLVISYATEAHLFITDMNQSPFNVGTRLLLTDFNREQVVDLNSRYGEPLTSDGEINDFCELVGGQPYLVRKGLDEMAAGNEPFVQFAQRADSENGPYTDHLRRILLSLNQDAELTDVVRGILRGQPCPTMESFYRLQGPGILAGDSAHDAKLRCRLYETYLARHLL